MLPVVAIVGRPNVGKSTLFNRILGQRKSVVHDRPGVTRDRIYGIAEFQDRRFWLIDTGGIEPDTDTDLLSAMRLQTAVAIEEADVIVFLVDGRAGYTPADMDVAERLRVCGKPVVLAVNKLDGPKHDVLSAEFWQLGVEELYGVSAEHGRGFWEFLESVCEKLPERTAAEDEADVKELSKQAGPRDDADDDVEQEIRIAVVGRPNVGKSTLVNRLLGSDRQVVDNAAGTTMDAIDSELTVDGRRYVLVDTAGVRRKQRIGDQLERFVSLRSIKTIERCHVALLVVDPTRGLAEQDARLARLVADRGRGLILLFNKWDLTKDDEEISANGVEMAMEQQLPHVDWAPHLFISAMTGKGVHRVLPMVDSVYENFDRRITTSELNRFFEAVVQNHTPPQRHHRPVRLYYATQTRVRPPSFVFWSNTPEGIPDQYKRYLQRQLRLRYGFEGVPLRLAFRKRRKLGEEPGLF